MTEYLLEVNDRANKTPAWRKSAQDHAIKGLDVEAAWKQADWYTSMSSYYDYRVSVKVEETREVPRPEPKWESGKTYAYVGTGTTPSDRHYTVTTVDKDGWCIATYSDTEWRYMLIPRDRKFYVEV